MRSACLAVLVASLASCQASAKPCSDIADLSDRIGAMHERYESLRRADDGRPNVAACRLARDILVARMRMSAYAKVEKTCGGMVRFVYVVQTSEIRPDRNLFNEFCTEWRPGR